MGDRRQTGKPPRRVATHPGQLSLAIPPWRSEYQRRMLACKQAHRAMHQPRIRGLAGVWLKADETEISAALRAAREGLHVLLHVCEPLGKIFCGRWRFHIYARLLTRMGERQREREKQRTGFERTECGSMV